jgi:hypothetical protein
MAEPAAPVRSWMSRMPDAAFLAILGALVAIGVAGLNFAIDVSSRLARMEERVNAIADRVGARNGEDRGNEQHASR